MLTVPVRLLTNTTGHWRWLGAGAVLIAVAMLVAIGIQATGARAEPDDRCADNRGLAHFAADDRLVMTYLYYWYDEESLGNPALALRPPPGQPFDWRDPAWHRQQLSDMATVGVDVALAVYWGDVADWSVGGLAAMVDARERLLREDVRPPAIGLMLDTNLYATMLLDRPELADLTSDAGIAAFADLVISFSSRVPICHQAHVGGRPLVFVWRPDTEDGDRFQFDQRTLAGVEDLLAARLGVRPLLVFERTWIDHAAEDGVRFEPEESFYWGAALGGLRVEGRGVALGPGYDDRSILDRPGYVRDRDAGQTYARDLRLAVLGGRPWLILETWNELWEGTAIAETVEHGREPLLTTRRYVELFHRLMEPARDGWFDLGSYDGAYIRRLADAPQEEGERVMLGGRLASRSHYEAAERASYFHFAVDPRLGIGPRRPVVVDVEYFDEGAGSFSLEYDSDDPSAPKDGRYAASRAVAFEDSGEWRTARFELADASFRSRQYGRYGDFRIRAVAAEDDPPHAFGRVVVTAQPGLRPLPYAPQPVTFLAANGTPDSGTVSLRWTAVDGAAGYVVDVRPFDAPEPTFHAFDPRDRARCAGGPLDGGRAIRGVTFETSCRLAIQREETLGLFRWRVAALDGRGQPIGDPSDWSFLSVTPD